MDLLRKKDLHPKVGVPKTTVADWITEFNIFIPKTRHERTTFYKPEAIKVLQFIKQCRDQGLQKHQIMQLLVENGFPITAEEENAEDILESIEKNRSTNDELLPLIKTTGQLTNKIVSMETAVKEQNERIQYLDERTDKQDERLNGQAEALKNLQSKQDGQKERLDGLEKRTDEIGHLKQENDDLKQKNNELQNKQVKLQYKVESLEQALKQVAAAQEKKGFLARLFGR